MNNTILIKPGKRQRFTDEEKKDLLKSFQESGTTRNKFAKQNGITAQSLTQWEKKFGSNSIIPFKRTETVQDVVKVSISREDQLIFDNVALRAELQRRNEQIAAMESFIGRKLFELECSKKSA